MTTSSYHINKQRPDLQYERPTGKERKKMHRNRHYLKQDLERLHQCKQEGCTNTFINVKGFCHPHFWAREQKIGALYNKGKSE